MEHVPRFWSLHELKRLFIFGFPNQYSPRQGLKPKQSLATTNDAKTSKAIQFVLSPALSKPPPENFGRFSTKMQKKGEELDFSKPWHLSDLTIDAEGKKFHVHRGILSMWSPVFEMKFMQKMKLDEITVDEKADEIKELLHVIYPSRKPVTQDTVQFLLPLAHDYKMGLLISLCEQSLLEVFDTLPSTHGDSCWFTRGDELEVIEKVLPVLLMAQKYDMESLRVHCINKLRGVHLTRMKENPNYEDVTDANRMEIAELRVMYYERRESY